MTCSASSFPCPATPRPAPRWFSGWAGAAWWCCSAARAALGKDCRKSVFVALKDFEAREEYWSYHAPAPARASGGRKSWIWRMVTFFPEDLLEVED